MFAASARARKACALFVMALACVRLHAAESSEPRGDLTLAQAIDATLRGNPDLAASGYELTAAQARIVQAGVRANPEFSLEFENFAGGGGHDAADALETTLSLSQVVELGSKRALRRSVAEADLDTATIEQRTRELDVLAEVTRRFIDVSVAQERVRFETEAAVLAAQTLDAIGIRVAAGRSPEAERSRARIGLTRAQIERQQAQSDLRSARYALSALWGSPEPAFTGSRAELFNLRPAGSLETLLRRLEHSPDLLRLAFASRLRDAELRLARAQARPNLNFSLGVRHFKETGDAALVAGFSMPLPVADRNQGAISEAQARLMQTEALKKAAQLRARASLVSIYQEMQAARVRVETLRGEALPQAQQALDQTRSGYERGRFSFLELVTAQEEFLALRAAAIDAAADYHRMLAEIERLTSAALTQPVL